MRLWNRCALPGCDERLTDPQWDGVRAEIAHICGERPGAARYDPAMTDAERDGYDNLLLLCPNHHCLIDRLRPDDWPPDRLQRCKAEHERGRLRRGDRPSWADDAELVRLAVALLLSTAPGARALGDEPLGTVIGGNVRRLRQDRKQSLEGLGQDLDLHRTFLGRIEAGQENVSTRPRRARRRAAASAVTVDEHLFDTLPSDAPRHRGPGGVPPSS